MSERWATEPGCRWAILGHTMPALSTIPHEPESLFRWSSTTEWARFASGTSHSFSWMCAVKGGETSLLRLRTLALSRDRLLRARCRHPVLQDGIAHPQPFFLFLHLTSSPCPSFFFFFSSFNFSFSSRFSRLILSFSSFSHSFCCLLSFSFNSLSSRFASLSLPVVFASSTPYETSSFNREVSPDDFRLSVDGDLRCASFVRQ